MAKKSISIDEALKRATALPFAMIRSLSDVYLGEQKIPSDLSDVIEARFFGPDEEIRLFRDGETLKAASVTEEGMDSIDKNFDVENSGKFGVKKISAKYILDYDEDGQAFISTTRLCGLEGK